ncbi:uncharacterized protein KD926_003360 [Aspergillus affinis]|uniref:uncharacterized protein n=1 Tax=Aspergillus affinis TaxID=1070780 RepID=UPI0022FE305C|nr:uncharacterized protein KD926_003360 [Aspergillus affinis]KAI9043590.1 hypothetical protein KD926_003360 [Aspergillus affinis]
MQLNLRQCIPTFLEVSALQAAVLDMVRRKERGNKEVDFTFGKNRPNTSSTPASGTTSAPAPSGTSSSAPKGRSGTAAPVNTRGSASAGPAVAPFVGACCGGRRSHFPPSSAKPEGWTGEWFEPQRSPPKLTAEDKTALTRAGRCWGFRVSNHRASDACCPYFNSHRSPYSTAQDGHTEQLAAYIAPLARHKLVLGDRWLTTHNPHIDFTNRTLPFNSPHCFAESYLPRGAPCTAHTRGSKALVSKTTAQITADNSISIVSARRFISLVSHRDHHGYLVMTRDGRKHLCASITNAVRPEDFDKSLANKAAYTVDQLKERVPERYHSVN